MSHHADEAIFIAAMLLSIVTANTLCVTAYLRHLARKRRRG